MNTYARVYEGFVVEIISTDADINTLFHPDFVASLVDVTGYNPIPVNGWTASNNGSGWLFAPYVAPVDLDQLSMLARQQREALLRGTYDPGIMMALRALRMASTPEQTSYAEGKIIALDEYAEALIAIPDQVGFPQTIVWPVAPTK